MFLDKEQADKLNKLNKDERSRRVDRVRAILLRNLGWEYPDIAQSLFLDKSTVRTYVEQYKENEKLDPAHKGSKSKLSLQHTKELIQHLTEKTYLKAQDICKYVKAKYDILYSRQGMTEWLHDHGFCYKKAKGIPAKADVEKQKAFIEMYDKELKNKPSDEPVVFMDAVHPSMATKLTHGWIPKGTDKHIQTTASRTRMNITGAVDIRTLGLLTKTYKSITGESTVSFLQELERSYPKATCIHVVLDQGPYHKSQVVLDYLPRSRMKLHFLPTYSPNLNPIERLWRIMNHRVRNNRYFSTAQEFKRSIQEFFENTWPSITEEMRSCITDKFQCLPVSR